MTTYVIARDAYILDAGYQRVSGYDQASVVGRGRTIRAAARKAGPWCTMNGYRLFEAETGKCLGNITPDGDVYPIG